IAIVFSNNDYKLQGGIVQCLPAQTSSHSSSPNSQSYLFRSGCSSPTPTLSALIPSAPSSTSVTRWAAHVRWRMAARSCQGEVAAGVGFPRRADDSRSMTDSSDACSVTGEVESECGASTRVKQLRDALRYRHVSDTGAKSMKAAMVVAS